MRGRSCCILFPAGDIWQRGAPWRDDTGPRRKRFSSADHGVLLTAGLVSTILGTAAGARNIGSNGALAVGGYIALAGLRAAPFSGASMNPVRSFVTDLVRGNLHPPGSI
ncbi:aquaporin [Acidocella facilis]|uniref:aquaporin n=1 Tax=Acidocella facilis TaxID=525 RepID=UPI0038D1DFAC